MPWPEAQRRAIFLNTKRRKGLRAAKQVMHEAGYGAPPGLKDRGAVTKKELRGKRQRPVRLRRNLSQLQQVKAVGGSGSSGLRQQLKKRRQRA